MGTWITFSQAKESPRALDFKMERIGMNIINESLFSFAEDDVFIIQYQIRCMETHPRLINSRFMILLKTI